MKYKVDFFIAGFSSSGSTAIAHYLSLHPEICFSIPKETHFFLPRTSNRIKNILTWRQYENCFSHTKDNQILGEASIYYVHFPESFNKILQHNKNAKFIILLRHPIENLISSYEQLVFTGNENASSFEEAWQLQEKRFQSNKFPPFCRDPIQLNYRKRVHLGQAVEDMLQIVPRDQVLFINFDEIRNNIETVYNKIQNFLGVSLFRLKEYPVINSRAKQRNVISKYTYLVLRRNRYFMSGVYKILRTLKKFDLDIPEVNRMFKSRNYAKVTIDEKLKDCIFDELKSDIKLLEKLSGISFSQRD